MVIVLFFVALLAFVLMRLSPGDPVRMYLPEDAPEAAVEEMREKLGLNEPYVTQFFRYINDLLHGDLGTSITYRKAIWPMILERLPTTAKITLGTVVVGLLISIPLGIIAGVNQGGPIDLFAMFFALLGQSMSIVWLGILLVFVFSVILGWLPAMGDKGFVFYILPSLTLGYPMAAQITRLGRSGMVDVLHEDFIAATRAKGIPDYLVYSKYAFKNALIPIITQMGLTIGTYLSGSVVVEQIFGMAGIGQLLFTAVGNRDYPLVQSLLVFSAAVFVIVNLIVDIINSIVDPRIKLE